MSFFTTLIQVFIGVFLCLDPFTFSTLVLCLLQCSLIFLFYCSHLMLFLVCFFCSLILLVYLIRIIPFHCHYILFLFFLVCLIRIIPFHFYFIIFFSFFFLPFVVSTFVLYTNSVCDILVQPSILPYSRSYISRYIALRCEIAFSFGQIIVLNFLCSDPLNCT